MWIREGGSHTSASHVLRSPAKDKVNESQFAPNSPPLKSLAASSPRRTYPSLPPDCLLLRHRRAVFDSSSRAGGEDGGGGAAGGVQPVRARVLPERRHPAPPPALLLLPPLPHRQR